MNWWRNLFRSRATRNDNPNREENRDESFITSQERIQSIQERLRRQMDENASRDLGTSSRPWTTTNVNIDADSTDTTNDMLRVDVDRFRDRYHAYYYGLDESTPPPLMSDLPGNEFLEVREILQRYIPDFMDASEMYTSRAHFNLYDISISQLVEEVFLAGKKHGAGLTIEEELAKTFQSLDNSFGRLNDNSN